MLSTRALAPAHAGASVERLSGEPADVLARLDERGIGHICVDGGITIQALPYFGAIDGYVALTYVRTQHHASGIVQSEYPVRAR